MVHEDSRSVSVSSEVIASVVERFSSLDAIKVSRIARGDTYVPCNFGNQLEVLPSYKDVLTKAVEMLGGTITWTALEETANEAVVDIAAVGKSPSDEQLTIISWKIKDGDVIAEGDFIAEGEADKAACDIKAPISGVVSELCVQEGETVAIGDAIARIQIDSHDTRVHTITREIEEKSEISFSSQKESLGNISTKNICISHTNAVLGNRIVDNKEIVSLSEGWTEEKIFTSTGIKQRHWIGKDQTLVDITYEAARKTLNAANLSIYDISGIICATGTHNYQTPSLAAMTQQKLVENMKIDSKEEYTGYAYDVSGACSGYIFALSAAYHRVVVNNAETVLLLTGEFLSNRLDMSDYGTAPVFSDAATATLVSTKTIANSDYGFIAHNPILQTVGESGKDLAVPDVGTIHMNGVEVYKIAVTHLTAIVKRICNENNITLDDIDLIVPHQANIKIINGVARRLQIPLDKFYVSIDKHGNSSSNTVPICLEELSRSHKLAGKKVLVIVFGGGYTFGGTLLDFS